MQNTRCNACHRTAACHCYKTGVASTQPRHPAGHNYIEPLPSAVRTARNQATNAFRPLARVLSLRSSQPFIRVVWSSPLSSFPSPIRPQRVQRPRPDCSVVSRSRPRARNDEAHRLRRGRRDYRRRRRRRHVAARPAVHVVPAAEGARRLQAGPGGGGGAPGHGRPRRRCVLARTSRAAARRLRRLDGTYVRARPPSFVCHSTIYASLVVSTLCVCVVPMLVNRHRR